MSEDTYPALAPTPRRLGPYRRLLRNRNFSLLWLGQLVSFMGDRLHQIALGVMVLAFTGSPLAVGLTFALTSVPNLLFAPLAGTLVDRWPHRRSMIAADLIRAGLVLPLPWLIGINLIWIYIITFAIATVSLLFRPAKQAAIPLVVDEGDLMAANSATTTSETMADLLGYPLAGVLVASLLGHFELIFALDSATYLVSAVCIGLMSIPAVERVQSAISIRGMWTNMAEGWNFLRHHRYLFPNTVVSVMAQVAIGCEIALGLVYAEQALSRGLIGYPENYAFLMTAIGVGSLLGGIVLGLVGDRYRKGLLAALGFAAFGLGMVAVGFITEPLLAIAAFFFIGVVNMVFLIPNITLFQEQTPPEMMGRVFSIRMALVFGVMTASMAVCGAAAEFVPAGVVFVATGLIALAAGIIGLAWPAVREAR